MTKTAILAAVAILAGAPASAQVARAYSTTEVPPASPTAPRSGL